IINYDSLNSSGAAVTLYAANNSLTNGLTGLIEGPVKGVQILGALGTVANYGTIDGTGTSSYGVYLGAGGNVTNYSGGLTEGASKGVMITGSAGTVINYGTIESTG